MNFLLKTNKNQTIHIKPQKNNTTNKTHRSLGRRTRDRNTKRRRTLQNTTRNKAKILTHNKRLRHNKNNKNNKIRLLPFLKRGFLEQ